MSDHHTKIKYGVLVLGLLLAVGVVLLTQSSPYESSSIPCTKYGTSAPQLEPGMPCAYPASSDKCYKSTYGTDDTNNCQEPSHSAAYTAGEIMTGVGAVGLGLLACMALRSRRGRKAAPDADAPVVTAAPVTAAPVTNPCSSSWQNEKNKWWWWVLVCVLLVYTVQLGARRGGFNWATSLGTVLALLPMLGYVSRHHPWGLALCRHTRWLVLAGLALCIVGLGMSDRW